MDWFRLFCTVCSLFLASSTADAKSVESRATTHYEMELLIVVDYSLYQHWYNTTDATKTADQRKQQAISDVKTYIGAVMHSTNLIYKNLETDGIFIQIRVVNMVFETHASESPWTETVKEPGNPRDTVEPLTVLKLFQNRSKSLQATIPHDYAMLFTWYSLLKDGDAKDGYAYYGQCHDKSVGMVKYTGNPYQASLVAHELGHSLFCNHDGDDNTCDPNGEYVMTSQHKNTTDRVWIFSNCSKNYIASYLKNESRTDPQCLETHQNNHVPAEITMVTGKLYGQVYSADHQCRFFSGPLSHFARESTPYDHGFGNMCQKLFCTVPGDNLVYAHDAGDGTPCGNRKWCFENHCVSSPNAPQVADNCPAGDQEGLVKNGQTCAALTKQDPSLCNTREIKRKCCHACANVIIPVASGDGQCRRHLGNNTYICRAASTYANHTYAERACRNFMCSDPSKDNWCNSYIADDRTPCGYQKWCMDGVCVHDPKAPSVPDTCPWGDSPEVVTAGLTCAELAPLHNHWRCNDDYVMKVCCKTCASVKANNTVNPADLGDAQCVRNVGTGSYICRNPTSYVNHTYADIVCQSLMCNDPTRENWCLHSLPDDHTPCGYKKWCMKGVCVHDNNALNVTDTCPWGDRPGVATAGLTCAELAKPNNQWRCHDDNVMKVCCGTCEKIKGASSGSPSNLGDEQCIRIVGDGSYICRTASSYSNKTYADIVCQSLMCNDPTRENWCLHSLPDDHTPCGYKKWCVHGHCVHNADAPAVPDTCPWGDRPGVVTANLTCADLAKPGNGWHCYDGYYQKVCCSTCEKLNTNNTACRYGDHSDWCYKTAPTIDKRRMCYFGQNSDLCCGTCARYADHAHPDCLYGDEYTDCRLDRCNSYDDATRKKCCGTCKQIPAPIIG